MGQITSGIGLVSGINTASIINSLIAIESAPVTKLQSRIATNTAQKGAYSALLTQINSLSTVGTTLTNPSAFQAATTASSDATVLTASAANGAATGTYQLQVAQLVSSQQAVTGGYADSNQTKLKAGTITISQGGGELSSKTSLAQLNGGKGVQRGIFRITDRSGKTATIDISSAVTLDDVVQKINTALDISVQATVGANGLVLTDQTGHTDPPPAGQPVAPDLIVQDIGIGHIAKDLGIAGKVAANTLTGTNVNTLGASTVLAQINDGRGIGTAATGDDFSIQAGDGSTFNVNLATAKTLNDVLGAINTAGTGKIVAAVNAGGNGIQLTDTTGGGGAIAVSALNGSTAATDLGILGTGTGSTLTGKSLIASLDSTLVSSLNGGSGVPLGTIGIVDRLGNPATIDLSHANSVQDILDTINQAGIGVTASLNNSGNGLQVTDTSGGSGPLKIFDVSGTSATALGLLGTYTSNVAGGSDLHHQYITASTLLSDYNGGKGITPGKFTITASTGATSQVDLTGANFVTIGDVLKTINSRAIGVTASINANGNGILLTDTAGGPTQLKAVDDTGTAAADLNIAGTATTQTIDGAFEKTIAVTANDTLSTVQQKINSLGFAVNANIINDGSGATPYRLSINAQNSGLAGRFVFDAGSTGLDAQNLVDAQNAEVFIGGHNSANPLLVSSNSNLITNVISGVTVNLLNTSAVPITLSVTQDSSAISTQLKNFTDGFNAVVTQLDTLTSFNTTTNTPGILLGDSTALTIESDLYATYNRVVQNAGRYRSLADLGITVATGSNVATLNFDATKFSSAFATDPKAVQNLFTQATTGLGTLISNDVKKLTDPISGAIPIETNAIDAQNQSFTDSITRLNDQIAAKRALLQSQFNNMEVVLSGLQSQQAALGSLVNIPNLSAPTSAASSSNSSTAASSSSSSGSTSSSSGSSGTTSTSGA